MYQKQYFQEISLYGAIDRKSKVVKKFTLKR